jgi:Protein of unknown function (DUF3987)
MLTSSEQLIVFRGMLEAGTYERDNPLFQLALDWIRKFPGDLEAKDKEELKRAICIAFGVTNEELQASLVGSSEARNTVLSARTIEDSLWRLIPQHGFFARYCEYTSHSEAPLAYHLFSALVGVGATVNRRIWFNMGYYRVFPNMGVIILGPSGIKKTSATNIMVGMLTELELTKIYSEKLTPEQLVEAMKDMAQGLIYAPEMAVFLGRQRYMEGIVPLITRFMDCPDVWASETVMRGKKVLRDVAISSLMCSTLDWFISNTSEDVVSGGFIARNIIVAQDSSPRLEPIPRPGDPHLRQALINDLARIHSMEGELTLTKECAERYDAWYRTQKSESDSAEHELLITYYQRKPDHVKRVAMCLHLADCNNLVLDVHCFNRAILIMDWIEQFVPPMLKRMFKTAVGHEQDLVLASVKSAGGVIEHSALVRRVQYRMNAKQLREIVNSLKEADMLEEIVDRLVHIYRVKEVPGG